MSFYITEEFIEEYRQLFDKRWDEDYQKYKEIKYIKRMESVQGQPYDYAKLNEGNILERLELCRQLIEKTPADSPIKSNLYTMHAHMMMLLCSRI